MIEDNGDNHYNNNNNNNNAKQLIDIARLLKITCFG